MTTQGRCSRTHFPIALASAVKARRADTCSPTAVARRLRSPARWLATISSSRRSSMIGIAKRASTWRPRCRWPRSSASSPTGSPPRNALAGIRISQRCLRGASGASTALVLEETTRRLRPGARPPRRCSTGIREMGIEALPWDADSRDLAGAHGIRAHAAARRSGRTGRRATMPRSWRDWINGCQTAQRNHAPRAARAPAAGRGAACAAHADAAARPRIARAARTG